MTLPRTASVRLAPDAAWQPDWPALASHIVQRSLRLRSGERVVYSADPYLYPELLEAVRGAVLQAGGIEQATLLHWTPGLGPLRRGDGRHPDAEAASGEDHAHLELFQSADVFLWLPHDIFRAGAVTALQTEWILGRWRGRGVHFHWFPDYGTDPAHPVHRALFRMYERAILDLDHAALRRRQRDLVTAIRGRSLRVTTPDGTDLRFRLAADAWFHCNDGDASREKALRAVCARDREEELPCGAVRTIPIAESVEGVVAFRRGQATRGRGLSFDSFTGHLDLVFHAGRIAELRAGERQAALEAGWAQQSGDRDRLGEVVFGTNPLLQLLDGARLPPYWGFGDGVVRLHLGDNTESGGAFQSSLSSELFLVDATVEADGEPVIAHGRLLVPF